MRSKNRPLEVAPSVRARILRHFTEETNAPIEVAERGWIELGRFLDGCADSMEGLAPSQLVDVLWHGLILHTADYERLCLERYGKMIHHAPGDAADSQRYGQTLIYLRSAGGEAPDPQLWPRLVAGKCEGDSNCGSKCSDVSGPDDRLADSLGALPTDASSHY